MGINQKLKKAYNRKKVLITGHTGFKGTWLVYMLKELGAHIKGYALEPGSGEMYLQTEAGKWCDSVYGDIRDQRKLTDVITDFKPDYIFHLAAQTLVRPSYKLPLYTFEVNTMGTAYLLEAVRKIKNPCSVIVVTTDKVYDNKEWVYPYRENDKLGGFDPYSASKACAELVTSSYRNSFFAKQQYAKHKKDISSVRAGNVIGGGDWAENRIVPDIIRSLQNGKTVKLRNPKAIRPWQHVMEALSGYLKLGAYMNQSPLEYSESWNFGPSEREFYTVEQLVQIAIDSWGKGTYDVEDLKEELHEANLLELDSSKANKRLDWSPVFKAKEAIETTMKWYHAVITGTRTPEEITTEQIREYLGRMDSKTKAGILKS